MKRHLIGWTRLRLYQW